MEDEEQDVSTPFWLQSRRSNTYFRRTTSLGGRTASVATQFLFLAAAVFLVFFFIIPPLLSSVSQIFRPHLVRKSWDYLNLVLVLFAVVCGFLSRSSNDNDGSNRSKEYNSSSNDVTSSYEYGYGKYSSSSSFDRGRRSNSATPRYWYEDRGGDQFSGQTVYKRFIRSRSNSYPDLRLRESDDDERWRFYDDTRVYDNRFDDPDRIHQSYRSWQQAKTTGEEERRVGSSDDGKKVESTAAAAKVDEVAEIKEHMSESIPSPQPSYPIAYPPSAPPAPPSPPPSKPVKRRTKRVYQDPAPKTERKEMADPVVEVPGPGPGPRPPPPPPPPPEMPSNSASVYQKSKKKRGGATKDFLIALRRKKKKQRQKSVDGLDILFGSDPSTAYSSPESAPHPPPPPPPPPPFFHSLFTSKKGKSKRTHSTSASPPPPPPPPPPHTARRHMESRPSTIISQRAALEARVSNPKHITAINRRDEIIVAGNKSPLLPIPPPPPPPPFKLPVWKFVKQGDYVRMSSDISLRSGSSDDPEDMEAVQSDGSEIPKVAMVGGESPARMFCPSPDVDTKADNFIARFRAGLRLEKMNSVKEKQRTGRSNLGPEPEYEPGSETEACVGI